MNILMIDCSHGMEIEVFKGNQRSSYVDYDEKKHTDKLLEIVDKQLENVGLKIKNIECVCVCVGPGSFTGIRVAISICKGLAITGDVKICTASDFDVIEQKEFKKAYYIIDGFSDYVYVRNVDGGNRKDECIKFSELVQKIKNDQGCEVACISEKTQNLLKQYEIQCKLLRIDITSCFLNKISRQEFTPINEISPIYLRASQAEIERDERLKNGRK